MHQGCQNVTDPAGADLGGIGAAQRAPTRTIVRLPGDRADSSLHLGIRWRHGYFRGGPQTEQRAVAPELELLFGPALARIRLLDVANAHGRVDRLAMPLRFETEAR
jgi:hypothetical protein